MSNDMAGLYQEIILDHYRAPHHAGLREPYDAETYHVNPTCGDEITLRVRVRDGVVEDVSYQAEGCSISQASTSVLADLMIGKGVAPAIEVFDSFVELMHGQGQIQPDEDVLEDGIAFAASRSSPRASSVLCWGGWRGRMPRRSPWQKRRHR